MKGKRILLFLLLLLAMQTTIGESAPPAVKVVLFYSPTCGHCEKVISEDLPPLIETYGEQLQVLAVDVSTDEGQRLYRLAIERFSIPQARIGVPTLIVGQDVLVGSREIPTLLPGLVEEGLAAGGIEWPDLPGLMETATRFTVPRSELGSFLARLASALQSVTSAFLRDPVANGLSVLVLAGMAVAVVTTLAGTSRWPRVPPGPWGLWVFPILVTIGMTVSGYLTWVELSQEMAICGPLGDCNAVQQSRYAMLPGGIPVAAAGLVGYGALLVTWLTGRLAGEEARRWADASVFVMALTGTVFSFYLTFLEPFVIGATCLWCLTSAIVMTLLMLLSRKGGAEALGSLRAKQADR